MVNHVKRFMVCLVVILLGTMLYFRGANALCSNMAMSYSQLMSFQLMSFAFFLGIGFPVSCAIAEMIARKVSYLLA